MLLLLLFACDASKLDDPGDTSGPRPSLLGEGDGTPGSVTWTPVLTAEDLLTDPRDLGFDAGGNLWVANREDDRTFVVLEPATDAQAVDRRKDAYAMHFMEETAALAFDTGAQFGSCGESRNTYDGTGPPNDFMGPVLWSTDLEIFAAQDPYGLGSHLDMLHESPLCVGIAWERDNVYWVFDGRHDAVVRYDFVEDHDVGQDDHSDGVVRRLTEPEVARVEDAPGHMDIDRETGLLYVADTGNGRVLWIDTATGVEGSALRTQEPGVVHTRWDGATWGVLVEGLDRPGGLALGPDRLYVAEHGTGLLHEYDRAGTHLRSLDTGLGEGAVYGIEVGPDGRLWMTEIATPAVVRVDP